MKIHQVSVLILLFIAEMLFSCGFTHSQLNLHDDKYKVSGHTYFEYSMNVDTTLEAVWLENELWTKLRLSPKILPGSNVMSYPNNNRSFTVICERKSPYRIAGWFESKKAQNGDMLRARGRVQTPAGNHIGKCITLTMNHYAKI